MKKKLLFIIFTCITYSFHAQEISFGKVPYTKVKSSQQKSTPISILFNDLKPSRGTEFRLVNTQKDVSNKVHSTYQQYYNGVKVEFGIIKIHQENRQTVAYNGAYFAPTSVQTSPRIQKSQVVSSAKRHMGTNDVFWLPTATNELASNATPDPELVILPNRRTGKLNLAYTLNIGVSSPELRMGTIYIDAQTGTVLKYKNRLFNCFEVNDGVVTHNEASHNTTNNPFVSGTAATAYSGSQSFETVVGTTTYILADETRATGSNWILSAQGLGTKTGIFTVDVRNTTDLTNTFYEFEDNDNNWTAAEMSSNDDQYALDVHWGSQIVYDYWANVRGRNSYNGNNSALMSIVHYGNNYLNAGWGAVSDDLGYMIYGDGAGSYTPLTTLDVVSHEIGHGITNSTAGLDYELESGALNEGLSDIWAIVVENYANNNHGTSKDISVLNEENGGGAIRSMSNPNAYGQPDTYGGTNWYAVAGCTPDGTNNDYCGVHTNSGVLNYWFWLLSQGGSGTNDLGDSFSVSAVGMDDAAAIVWQMQNNYLTATSDYAAARTAAIQAAVDLYGTCSSQEQAVTNAFYAVGVGSAFQATLPTITSQPSDITIAQNGGEELSLTANDYTSISWEYSDDEGSTWHSATGDPSFTGSNTDTIAISLTNYDIGYLFRATLTNNCGSITSNEARVIVLNYTQLQDANFETALVNLGIDTTDGDLRVATDAIEGLTDLDISNSSISDLTGIEDFTALQTLTANNNTISTANLNSNQNLTVVNLRANGLTSLDISSCIDMDVLLLENNSLTSLDISNNLDLTRIWAQNNNINALDVTNNLLLRAIGISNSNLTSLNLTQSTAIEQLYASGNSITEIDLSNCTSIRVIGLGANNLESLNVQNGNNTNITTFSISNNPNLTCIKVDDAAVSTATWTVDDQMRFSETDYCDYTIIPDANFEAALKARGLDDDVIVGGDGRVPTALIESETILDFTGESITDVTGIEDFVGLVELSFQTNNITSIDVSNLTNLTYLNVSDNGITDLDLSNNVNLETLVSRTNPLTALNVDTNVALQQIYSSSCNITAIDITNNPAITLVRLNDNDLSSANFRNGNNANITDVRLANNDNLTCIFVDDPTESILSSWSIGAEMNFTDTEYCDYTNIPDAIFEAELYSLGLDDIESDGKVPTALIEVHTNLDIINKGINDLTGIEDFTALIDLDCSRNNLTSLDLSSNTALELLNFENNSVNSIDLSNNTALRSLDITNNNMTVLDLSNNILIEGLDLKNIPITQLDLSNNPALLTLNCKSTGITSLDLSNNPALTTLIAFTTNDLTSINLSNNPNLESIACYSSNLNSLDVSSCTALKTIDVRYNNFTSLDFSSNGLLETVNVSNNDLTYLNMRNQNNGIITSFISTSTPNLTCISVDDTSANFDNWTIDAASSFSSSDCRYTAIPDANFETALYNLNLDDIEGDGQVPTELIEVRANLNISGQNITDLTGIEDFTALETLIANNNSIITVDLSANTDLETCDFANNNITTIDLTGLTNLDSILLEGNDLSSIDLSTNIALEEILLDSNINLTSLDLTTNVSLERLYISGTTNLTTITFGNSPQLRELLADDSGLTSLDVSLLTGLEQVKLENTFIQELDLTNNTILKDVDVRNTLLTSLNIQNGANNLIETLVLFGNTNLFCVLVDDVTYANDTFTLKENYTNYSATYCRYTIINDANFEAAIEAIITDDVSGDGKVPTELIEVLTILNVSNQGITDLTGIEDFTSLITLNANYNGLTTIDLSNNILLETLDLNSNALTSLDLSNNTNLTSVILYLNSLTTLDVSANTVLTDLFATSNQLATLDVSNCTSLENLQLGDNNLTSIDVSTNTMLETIGLFNNQLTSIDLSSNTNITSLDLASNSLTGLDFSTLTALTSLYVNDNDLNALNVQNGASANISNLNASGNSNLNCMLVDDASDMALDSWILDDHTTFSDTGYCNYTQIPDAIFEAALGTLDLDDTPNDGKVPTALIEDEISLDIRELGITDLTGIEAFTSLTSLRCENNSLSELNIATLTNLNYLWCEGNALTSLDLSNNTQLLFVSAGNNALTSFDGTGLSAVDFLNLYSNQLETVDVSEMTALKEVRLYGNQLTFVDLSNNTLLEDVDLKNNLLASVDIKNGANGLINSIPLTGNLTLSCVRVDDAVYSTDTWTQIEAITNFSDTYCRYTTIPDTNFEAALEALGYDDISGDGQVPTKRIEDETQLAINYHSIIDLSGIEGFAALEELDVLYGTLASLDVSQNANLKILKCGYNAISSLDVSNNLLLEELIINDTSIETLNLTANTNLTNLVASSNTSLVELNIQNGTNTIITNFFLEGTTNLSCILVDDATYSADNWEDIEATTSFSDTYCRYTNIPDANFEAALEAIIADDISGDGKVPTVLIEAIADLNVRNKGITDLTGIEDFAALEYLQCAQNSLTTLDLSNNPLVEELNCQNNLLTSLNVSVNTELQVLFCGYNQLTTLNIANNTELYDLECDSNNFSTLDLTNNINLTDLNANYLNLTSIDLSNQTVLNHVALTNCSLISIDLSNNLQLNSIYLSNNPIDGDLDLTAFTQLETLELINCGLTNLNLQNGNNANINSFVTTGNAELSCIRVDDATYSTDNWEDIDPTTIFSETYCRYTNIPDANFEAEIEAIIVDDISGDGKVPTELIEVIVDLNVRNKGITDLTGIEGFTALTSLNCSFNTLATVDLSQNTLLESLQIQYTGLTAIDLSTLTELTFLRIFNNSLTALDLTNNTKLESLHMRGNNAVATLNLTNNPLLEYANIQQMSLTTIDLSNNTALTTLQIDSNDLIALDISNNTSLEFLDAAINNMTSITFGNNPNLHTLDLSRNELITVDVSGLTALTSLNLDTNELTSLNVQNGNNSNFSVFYATENENLTCVLVDDVAYSELNWSMLIDDQASYSETSCDSVVVDIDVFLQGALINPNTGEESAMRDDLRAGNHLLAISPYGDDASFNSNLLVYGSTSNAIVDWVWVELRDKNNSTTVIAGQSAVLQRDGDVVSTADDMVTPLTFENVAEGSYYVVVKHRNHLGIMTASPISLTATATTIDFTDANNQITYGSNAQTTFGMPTDVVAMWCGNVNGDTVVQYSGTTPDTPDILSIVLNNAGNFLNFPTYAVSGYYAYDVNMDGSTQYSGTDPDVPFILQNILAHPGNFLNFSTYQIIEQLPENFLID